MSNDLKYSAISICLDIDRMQQALDLMVSNENVSDEEALALTIFDLENAKAAILLALCGKEVAH